jgi:hypothetical protein
MTQYTYPQPGHQPTPPGGGKDCADCKPGELGDLACDAEGLQKQAAYLAEAEKQSKPRREKFDKARGLYVEARAKAEAEVRDVRNQVKHIKDQLGCLVTDENRKQCLVDALEDVLDRLAKCPGSVATGCCAPKQCDVDIPENPADYPKRRAEIEALTKASEACFDALIDEPAAIPVRVADLKKRATDLAAAVGKLEKTSPDLDRVYATMLVLEHDVQNVWRGFKDVDAWYDCLCAALSCALKGRQALGVLVHHLAVEECKRKAETDACTLLAQNLVTEVVAVCHRRCMPAEGAAS